MVRRVQVRGNHYLMFSGKCEGYVFKTVGMASNLFKKNYVSPQISLSICGQEAQRAESEQGSAPNNDV